MTDFVAYPSRWRIALLILLAAGFVVLGLWMGGALGPPLILRRYPLVFTEVFGWLSVVFFGLCGVVAARRFFDKSEQLRIGPAGIRWARWSDQTIPWSDVADVGTWQFRGQSAIILRLRDPARFPSKRPLPMLAGFNRALTGGDIAIMLAGTDRSLGEAMTAIRQHYAQRANDS